jgi:hypothetical protein
MDPSIWPTRPALWWILSVARVGASAPLAPLGAVSVTAVVVAVLVSSRHRLVAGAIIAAVIWASWTVPPVGSSQLSTGAVLHVGDIVVVEVDSPTSPRAVLEGLRSRGVSTVDILIARRGGARDASVVATIRDRLRVHRVLVPKQNRVPDSEVVAAGKAVQLSGANLVVRSAEGALVAETGLASREG